ncbi:hypothetical protein QBC44DRAFT_64182 [Cladorrhinum sp. PSN332]|nr:hypothetical protein QBC44DRAFT_64182 [Cladorrhinum sp. PSN332]
MTKDSLQRADQGEKVWSGQEDDELQKIWEGVVSRVRIMAGNVEGAKLDPNLNINGVLALVHKARSADKESSDSGVVGVIDKTLNCIQTVGGLVADAASNVFGTANTCFNALNFVIQAYQGYQGIFQSLEGLLEKCFQFLQRLSYYKSKMDTTLRKVICEHLALFVEICEYIISLRGKRTRFKAFMKTTFLGDSHVQALLENMENLKGHEFGLLHAQTFSAVKTMEGGLSNVETGVNHVAALLVAENENRAEQKAEKATDKLLENFLNALGWNSTGPEAWQEVSMARRDGLKREPKQIWSKTLAEHIQAQTVSDMGEWINTNAQFLAWRNSARLSSPILGIEGGDGSGKTALFAKIIQSLQQHGMTGSPGARSSVAYFFVETDSKENANKYSVAESVTRNVLWQLGRSDRLFLKSAMRTWEENRVSHPPNKLWDQMLFDNTDRGIASSTCFIMIDGMSEDVQFHEFLVPVLRKLIQSPESRVRILLTGKKGMFKALEEQEGLPLSIIRLGEANSGDIRLYVEHQMNLLLPFLQEDSANTDVVTTRNLILDTLQRDASADYNQIQLVIGQIKDNPENLKEILKEAGTSAVEQIKKDIEQLNETASAQTISDINEIILWLLFGNMWKNTSELEGALQLKALTNADGETVPTGLPLLEFNIKQRKYLIFEIKSGVRDYVDFKGQISLDDARKAIPCRSQNAVEGAPSTRQFLHPAEVDLVKHYLKTLCPEQLYAKFGFDKFFEEAVSRRQNTSGNTNYIHQDKQNGYLLMALRCLVNLVEQRDTKTREIYSYSKEFLYSHLFDAAHRYLEGEDSTTGADTLLARSDHAYRVKAGDLLVRLFTEDYAIRSLFEIGLENSSQVEGDEDISWLSRLCLPSAWEDWVLTTNGMDVVTTLFKDSAVADKIRYADFFKQVTSLEDKKQQAFLDPAVRAIGGFLKRLDVSASEVEDAFLFVLVVKAVLDGVDLRDPLKQQQYLLELTVDQIQEVEKWAQGKLKVEDQKNLVSIWEAHMACVLYCLATAPGRQIPRMVGRITVSDAETRARKAIDLDPDNYRASYFLAQATKSSAESVDILQSLVDRLSSPDSHEWQKSDENKRLLVDILFTLGDKLILSDNSDQVAEAVTAYLAGLAVDVTYRSGYQTVISQYAKKKMWPQIVEFIKTLGQQQPSSSKPDPLVRLMHKADLWGSQGLVNQLVEMAKNTDNWDLLRDLYRRALTAENGERTDRYTRFYLRRALGCSLVQEPNFEAEGLKKLEDLAAELSDEWMFYDIMRDFMRIYVPRALSSLPLRNQYADRLEDLYGRFKQFGALTEARPALVFARYFLLANEHSRAKLAALGMVKMALEMLSDDDSSNDYWAFWNLAWLFSAFDDQTNAVAAFNMLAITRKLEADKHEAWKKNKAAWAAKKTSKGRAAEAERDTNVRGATTSLPLGEDQAAKPVEDEDEEEEPPEVGRALGPIFWCDVCDDDCVQEDFLHASEVWICMDDLGIVNLHDECYEQFKGGEVCLDDCNKSHEFFFIGKQDYQEVVSVKPNHVRVGNEEITLEEWKDRIRREYVDGVGGSEREQSGPRVALKT